MFYILLVVFIFGTLVNGYSYLAMGFILAFSTVILSAATVVAGFVAAKTIYITSRDNARDVQLIYSVNLRQLIEFIANNYSCWGSPENFAKYASDVERANCRPLTYAAAVSLHALHTRMNPEVPEEISERDALRVLYAFLHHHAEVPMNKEDATLYVFRALENRLLRLKVESL